MTNDGKIEELHLLLDNPFIVYIFLYNIYLEM